MATIQLENRSFNALQDALTEAEKLSSLEHPTSQQRTRINVLLAKISAIKSSVPVNEANAWEIERLRKSAGLPPDAPMRGDPERAKLWRDFIIDGVSRG